MTGSFDVVSCSHSMSRDRACRSMYRELCANRGSRGTKGKIGPLDPKN
jgi:hypothetical protein